jgi:hypothetical protein
VGVRGWMQERRLQSQEPPKSTCCLATQPTHSSTQNTFTFRVLGSRTPLSQLRNEGREGESTGLWTTEGEEGWNGC